MATDDERIDEGDDRDRDRPRRRERPDYEEAHRGGLILALGIISLVVCGLIGIAPWMMGNADLKAMDEGRMDPEGKQLTQVGKILGMVGVILFIVGMCGFAAYMVFMFAVIGAAGAGGGR